MSRLDWCKNILLNRDCYDWKNDNCDGCNIFKAYCEGARRAKNSIVRCKDCIHGKPSDEVKDELVYCLVHPQRWVSETFYCADGERREP